MIPINLRSEFGRLNAVLLHRPGVEIEAMTPENAANALYSDILNLDIVNQEYSYFAGTLEKCAKEVYYVKDLLQKVLELGKANESLVRLSCEADGCDFLVDELLQHDPATLATELIEGFKYRKGKDPERFAERRYLLQPLYNLFFTRDASSCMFDGALINSMSFDVRVRESYIYKAIFEQLFDAKTLWAQHHNPLARTEGGDVHIVNDSLLAIGNGIRTNRAGIDYLVQNVHGTDGKLSVVVQELPHSPESFIHLDMVFTFLGPHRCMAYEPLLKKTGIFSTMNTYVLQAEPGKDVVSKDFGNILEALRYVGMDLEPVICGGNDAWVQQREQWHSGANFFSFGENHIIGYRRNARTIEALDKAGFSVLKAEDVSAGKIDPWDYKKCVVTFAASELPRGGGGARCMTCPINRDAVDWNK